jgi:hypothetical protein
MKTSHLLAMGLVLLSLNLQAQTTWYMTPTGTGARNGTNWANAFSATSNQQMMDIISGTLQPGDTLLIGGSTQAWTTQTPITGTNTPYLLPPPGQHYGDRRIILTGSASGTPSQRKSIIGVDRGFGYPVFFGPQGTRSYTTISLRDDCSYLTIKNLEIHRRQTAISATGTSHKGLVIEGVKAHSMRESAFYFLNCENLLVEKCTATKYTKKGFQLHYNSHNVTFRDCLADCTQGENDPAVPANWINQTSSPIGFDFHQKALAQPANTAILLERCVARNNLGLVPSDYPQGDGFMVQQGNVGITFSKCISDTATDAAYDLKGMNQVINDSVAVNGRKSGVKVWYQGTFNNFAAVNNGTQFLIAASGTHSVSGPIEVNRSTFHSGTTTQRGIFIETTNRTSSFKDCLFTFAGAAGPYLVGPTGYTPPVFTPSGTGAAMGRYANAGNSSNAPYYTNPIIPWNGVGTNYDNQLPSPGKGYNSTALTPLPTKGVISVNLANSSTNALAASDIAGVVPAGNWNNSTAANELLTSIVNNNGTTVPGTTVVFAVTNFGYVNATVTPAPPLDDDAKMMRSHRAGSNTNTSTATVTGLPYASYDVYVYWGGKPTTASSSQTLTVELQQLSGGLYSTTHTLVMKDTNYAWDGTYNESTAATAAAAVDGNEYVVFRNVTTPEFRIRTTGATRTGLSGFQVVEQ